MKRKVNVRGRETRKERTTQEYEGRYEWRKKVGDIKTCRDHNYKSDETIKMESLVSVTVT